MPVLREKERLNQRFEFGAWAGTPRALANLASSMVGRVLPGAEFEAAVVGPHESERVAGDPDSLGTLEPHEKVREVNLTLSAKALDDDRLVSVSLGPHTNRVSCWGRSETEARAMLDTAKEILKPRIPWWSSWRLAPGMLRLDVALGFLVALAALALALFIARPGRLGLVLVWSVVTLLAVGAAFLVDWLLPCFELHSGKTRWRRFWWGLFSLVVLPVALTLLVRD